MTAKQFFNGPCPECGYPALECWGDNDECLAHLRKRPAAAQPFARLQREIGEWGDRTFTQATPASIATHLLREAHELRERPWSGEEMADVAMLLCHLAHRHGIDLQTEIEQKLALNRMRKWGEPDAQGVVEHVR